MSTDRSVAAEVTAQVSVALVTYAPRAPAADHKGREITGCPVTGGGAARRNQPDR